MSDLEAWRAKAAGTMDDAGRRPFHGTRRRAVRCGCLLGQRQQRHAASGQQQQGDGNTQVFHRAFLSWRSALIVGVWHVKQR